MIDEYDLYAAAQADGYASHEDRLAHLRELRDEAAERLVDEFFEREAEAQKDDEP